MKVLAMIGVRLYCPPMSDTHKSYQRPAPVPSASLSRLAGIQNLRFIQNLLHFVLEDFSSQPCIKIETHCATVYALWEDFQNSTTDAEETGKLTEDRSLHFPAV